jgi:hypothetical protein
MQPRLNIQRMLVQWYDPAVLECMQGGEILWRTFIVDMDRPYCHDAICSANPDTHNRAFRLTGRSSLEVRSGGSDDTWTFQTMTEHNMWGPRRICDMANLMILLSS